MNGDAVKVADTADGLTIAEYSHQRVRAPWLLEGTRMIDSAAALTNRFSGKGPDGRRECADNTAITIQLIAVRAVVALYIISKCTWRNNLI